MEGARTAHFKERIGIKRVGCGSAYAKCENTQGTARRKSTWIPPRFSSSYLSFCWLAAAAGTAGAAGIKQRNPAAKSPLLALLQRLRQNLFRRNVISIERSTTLFWRL